MARRTQPAGMGRSGALALLVLCALVATALAPSGCGEPQVDTATDANAADDALGKVAYEFEGAVYVKSLPDGDVRRLAEGTMPRWSPSGGWLLLERGGVFHVVGETGAQERAVSPNRPVWVPNDDRLAYWDGDGIVLEAADGTSRRTVITVEGQVTDLAFSPGGSCLAYTEELPGGGPSGREARLSVVATGAGACDGTLYRSTEDGLSLAGWTADGEYVLFWRDLQFSASLMADGTTLEAVPVTGGEPRPLYSGLTLDEMWSPALEGPLLAVTEGVGRESWANKRIAVVDAVTGGTTPLTDEGTASLQPAWSPDGERIAFVSQREDREGFRSGKTMPELSRGRRLWVMDADGGDRRRLTDDPAYRDERPRWSSDGSLILFARIDGEMKASLWLVPPDGGAPQQVVAALGSGPVFDYYGSVSWNRLFDWWQQ